MTAYATVADAEELLGVSFVSSICDRDDDGVVDTAAFTRQLGVATQQMNGYMLGRYPLPLAPTYEVPEIFKKICCDIAAYNSARTADVRDTEARTRYDDAIEYMTMIAKNQIKIPLALAELPDLPVTQINKSQEATTVPGRAICVTSPYRVFTPDNTRKLLG